MMTVEAVVVVLMMSRMEVVRRYPAERPLLPALSSVLLLSVLGPGQLWIEGSENGNEDQLLFLLELERHRLLVPRAVNWP